jgi:hypothetical protein
LAAPFGLIVAIAVVLAAPTVMMSLDGAIPFDAAVVRFLAALAVSWLLTNLVLGVARAMMAPRDRDLEEPDVSQAGLS